MPSIKPSIVATFFFLCSALSCAAMLITIEYKGQDYPVIGVRNTKPIILVDGKKKVLHRYTMQYSPFGAKAFTDGYFEIKDVRGDSLGFGDTESSQSFNAGFRWLATMRTSIDMKDAYVAFQMKTLDRKEGIVLMDLPGFKAGKWKRVVLEVDTVHEIGGGTFKTIFYNGGELLLKKPEYDTLKLVKKVEPNDSGKITEYPKVVKPFVPQFPEELVGVIEKGTVRLEFTIDAFGKAADIKVLKTDHEGLNAAAIEVIRKTEFSPAKKGFIPVDFRLRQNIEIKAPSSNK